MQSWSPGLRAYGLPEPELEAYESIYDSRWRLLNQVNNNDLEHEIDTTNENDSKRDQDRDSIVAGFEMLK